MLDLKLHWGEHAKRRVPALAVVEDLKVFEERSRKLGTVGIDQAPVTVLADAGYWNVPQISRLTADGSQVIVNPDSSARPARTGDARRLPDKRGHGLYVQMQRVITSDEGAVRGPRLMVQPLCELQLVSGSKFLGELVRGEISVGPPTAPRRRQTGPNRPRHAR
jgi:hypothetical protein